MAEIKLSELRPAGSELLQDSESFLTELNDRQIENVVGGDSNHSVVVRVLPVDLDLSPVLDALPQHPLSVILP